LNVPSLTRDRQQHDPDAAGDVSSRRANQGIRRLRDY
jgi:hypothetical protein